MRTVIQRVARADVTVGEQTVGRIDKGALLLIGVESEDSEADAIATAAKVASLRFFPGRTPMDLTLLEVGGACLVVSQFTLVGALRKGNRPSFTRAAAPDGADRLYLRVADELRGLGLPVATGEFGAQMRVELVNDGPVTLLLFVRGGRVVE
jgi:D-tyrosyl-tRNA(Tyr) deacylase